MSISIITNFVIAKEFNNNNAQIDILWQLPAQFFIGMGDIFCLAVGYEAVFKIAPKNQKSLASGIQSFIIGIWNYVSLGINSGFAKDWYPTDTTTEAYVNSDYNNYFWMIFGKHKAPLLCV
jgi:dipeptide/tripeptide permease